jgi:hypothetical protein
MVGRGGERLAFSCVLLEPSSSSSSSSYGSVASGFGARGAGTACDGYPVFRLLFGLFVRGLVQVGSGLVAKRVHRHDTTPSGRSFHMYILLACVS